MAGPGGTACWWGAFEGGKAPLKARPAMTAHQRDGAAPGGAVPSAIVAGGLFLLWPAFWNGYPLLFTDSGAFLHQTVGPLMIWDKPWIYGPLLHLFHWQVSLWLAVLGQGVVISWLLWLVLRVLGRAGAGRHLAICAGLAAFTTLPFSAALIMPDVLVAAVVLPAFLLGFGWGGLGTVERVALILLAGVATASHLSFLPLSAGLGVIVLLLRGRAWALLPLVVALGLLLGTNRIGHGAWSVSPYGSTFLLARLIADGPAARTIADRCATGAPGWYLCAWAGRLPEDSDVFLWSPDSPVNRDADGRARFLGGALLAPEARVIVAETLAREPGAVASAVLANTLRQMLLIQPGDTLIPNDLEIAVRPRLVEGFGTAEAEAFDAGLQARGLLVAPPWPWLFVAVVLLALPVLAWRVRGDRPALCLALIVLAGLVGNAAATGGLSKPHHRYHARIVWLLPFAAMVVAWPRRPARQMPPATAAGLQPRGRRAVSETTRHALQ